MKPLNYSLIITGLLFAIATNASQFPQNNSNKQKTFRSGEKLTFLLHYGMIKGGKATLTLNDSHIDSNTVFHAKINAKSAGITDKLFKIDDTYESYFDYSQTLPYKSIRDISEGSYTYYNEVDFLHNDTLVYSSKSGEQSVPHGTLDMVSAFYYLRTLNIDILHKGDVILVNTFFDDELFPFHLRYKGTEKVKTKKGKVKCHRFDPVVEPGRIFKSEDDMSMWLTADENMVPVLVKFDLIVGSVKCELIQYENLQTNINWE